MEDGVYDTTARVESEHWWFRGRRMLFTAELRTLKVGANVGVLDIGTGIGSNLHLLREEGYQDVTGIDLNLLAIRYCLAKGFTSILAGDATRLPFAEGQFDIVLATDTIEHIDDDGRALQEIHRVLVPGGHAMIVVPAFQSLWGLQDVVAQHKRRYRTADLSEKIQSTGLAVQKIYYFNYLLFVPIWFARQVIKILGIKRTSEAEFNSPALNQLLLWTFSFDVRTAPLIHPPFGVSIMAIAQKSKQA
jgi:SAM-dependent methyltransferase